VDFFAAVHESGFRNKADIPEHATDARFWGKAKRTLMCDRGTQQRSDRDGGRRNNCETITRNRRRRFKLLIQITQYIKNRSSPMLPNFMIL